MKTLLLCFPRIFCWWGGFQAVPGHRCPGNYTVLKIAVIISCVQAFLYMIWTLETQCIYTVHEVLCSETVCLYTYTWSWRYIYAKLWPAHAQLPLIDYFIVESVIYYYSIFGSQLFTIKFMSMVEHSPVEFKSGMLEVSPSLGCCVRRYNKWCNMVFCIDLNGKDS